MEMVNMITILYDFSVLIFVFEIDVFHILDLLVSFQIFLNKIEFDYHPIHWKNNDIRFKSYFFRFIKIRKIIHSTKSNFIF